LIIAEGRTTNAQKKQINNKVEVKEDGTKRFRGLEVKSARIKLKGESVTDSTN